MIHSYSHLDIFFFLTKLGIRSQNPQDFVTVVLQIELNINKTEKKNYLNKVTVDRATALEFISYRMTTACQT